MPSAAFWHKWQIVKKYSENLLQDLHNTEGTGAAIRKDKPPDTGHDGAYL